MICAKKLTDRLPMIQLHDFLDRIVCLDLHCLDLHIELAGCHECPHYVPVAD